MFKRIYKSVAAEHKGIATEERQPAARGSGRCEANLLGCASIHALEPSHAKSYTGVQVLQEGFDAIDVERSRSQHEDKSRTGTREHAHQLIDLLPETQLSALVGLLETIVDPVAMTLRNAPIDDEPESEEEKHAVAEARDWLKQNGGKGIPHEEAMRRLELE